MKHSVYITDPAKEELDRAYKLVVVSNPKLAPLVHRGIVDALLSCGEFAGRGPPTLVLGAGEEIRGFGFMFGYRPTHRYSILFSIRGNKVVVLHIRKWKTAKALG